MFEQPNADHQLTASGTQFLRQADVAQLGALLQPIDTILEADRIRPVRQRHTVKRIFERLRDEHDVTSGYAVVTGSHHCRPGAWPRDILAAGAPTGPWLGGFWRSGRRDRRLAAQAINDG